VKAYQIGGQKLQFPVVSAIYQAFCSCKKDIGDVNVLAQISQNVGVMPKEQVIYPLWSSPAAYSNPHRQSVSSYLMS
jgi:hypothetical protein